MFDLYMEKSPSVLKVAVMLEECDLEYRIQHVSVSQGQQHEPAFRKLAPNGKVPVLVDHSPAGGGDPLTIFESGAILLYLAEKTGRYLSPDLRLRSEIIQWLFWQSSGLSPMSGQAIHFTRWAPEETRAYGTLRYTNEVLRLYGVLNQRLEKRDFICGDYSIADIGAYSWLALYMYFKIDLADFPALQRWQQTIAARPAVQRAYARANAEINDPPPPSTEQLKNLFGATASALKPPPPNFRY